MSYITSFSSHSIITTERAAGKVFCHEATPVKSSRVSGELPAFSKLLPRARVRVLRALGESCPKAQLPDSRRCEKVSKLKDSYTISHYNE